ncbi:MAG: hypothetical protein L6R40_003106 [Gallowayella cf. fulva]|nr:MAG: hypothetical protein L6R40_003106 [Xanthomendoza cf. fulva]
MAKRTTTWPGNRAHGSIAVHNHCQTRLLQTQVEQAIYCSVRKQTSAKGDSTPFYPPDLWRLSATGNVPDASNDAGAGRIRKLDVLLDLLPAFEAAVTPQLDIGDFIESRVHENLDVLAFDAASLFFQNSERSIGFSPSITFFLRFTALSDLVEGTGRLNRTYRFTRQWYQAFQRARHTFETERAYSRAFIALGSNIGDRLAMIDQACSELTRRGLKVRHTSSLYETEAMYKTDQQRFVNGVCEIETTLPPLELLDQLKDIEKSLGRVKTVQNGPRSIDLDILLYDDQIVNEERLQIPHPRISEREFVLRPLCDLIPKSFLPQPNILVDFSVQLSSLPPSSVPISPLTPLTRFTSLPSTSQPSQILTSTLPTRKTHLMAILNLTPDSFSKDGKHTPTFTPSSLLPQLHSLLQNQISILDIGGQSTRPHATPLSAKEELARVLPTVKFIRQDPAFKNILLSIDTYHSSVARACIEAGADIVNDVSGGLMDKNMFATVAELGCTYILMHMRGTPETMNTLTDYPNGIIDGVASELDDRVNKAMEAGVRRWRIILDPGIGFAKTADQNLEILRKLPELRDWEAIRGLPWCVGVSRKGFVGKVSDVDGGWKHPRERGQDDDAPPRYIATENKGAQPVKGETNAATGLGSIKMSEGAWGIPPAGGELHQDTTPTHNSTSTPIDREEIGKAERAEGEAAPRYIATETEAAQRIERGTKDATGPDSIKMSEGAWGIPPAAGGGGGGGDTLHQDTAAPTPTPPGQEGEAKGDAGPAVQNMKERVWGTAAAVTACVQGGADVVRVHDWEEMARVVRMGEAVWRV